MTIAKAGFGGGCHWCTEGVFQSLRGVTQVDQGFVQSDAPADTWAEGVIVTFDSTVIQLETLSEVHLRTHSATRARSRRTSVSKTTIEPIRADLSAASTSIPSWISSDNTFRSWHSLERPWRRPLKVAMARRSKAGIRCAKGYKPEAQPRE